MVIETFRHLDWDALIFWLCLGGAFVLTFVLGVLIGFMVGIEHERKVRRGLFP
jgi:hypothetical protein